MSWNQLNGREISGHEVERLSVTTVAKTLFLWSLKKSIPCILFHSVLSHPEPTSCRLVGRLVTHGDGSCGSSSAGAGPIQVEIGAFRAQTCFQRGPCTACRSVFWGLRCIFLPYGMCCQGPGKVDWTEEEVAPWLFLGISCPLCQTGL
jgi:hypothetical protein